MAAKISKSNRFLDPLPGDVAFIIIRVKVYDIAAGYIVSVSLPVNSDILCGQGCMQAARCRDQDAPDGSVAKQLDKYQITRHQSWHRFRSSWRLKAPDRGKMKFSFLRLYYFSMSTLSYSIFYSHPSAKIKSHGTQNRKDGHQDYCLSERN